MVRSSGTYSNVNDPSNLDDDDGSTTTDSNRIDHGVVNNVGFSSMASRIIPRIIANSGRVNHGDGLPSRDDGGLMNNNSRSRGDTRRTYSRVVTVVDDDLDDRDNLDDDNNFQGTDRNHDSGIENHEEDGVGRGIDNLQHRRRGGRNMAARIRQRARQSLVRTPGIVGQNEQPLVSNPTFLTSVTIPAESNDGNDNNNNNDPVNSNDSAGKSTTETSQAYLTVTVLDFMHKRFQVPVPRDGTVLDLKRAGHVVHKVPVSRQRLIYRGQLLGDDTATLASCKITDENTIVHLFPKPRVIVVQNDASGPHATSTTTPSSGPVTSEGETTTNNRSIDNDDSADGGARVPTIVMNADEAERRSQILVLGSPDYLEAQNNVKLFSFMLLIISSIELLNIFAIAMGFAQKNVDPEAELTSEGSFEQHQQPWTRNVDDDINFPMYFNNTDGYSNISQSGTLSPSGYIYDDDDRITSYAAVNAAASMVSQTWGPLSYFDLVVSLAGIYVACLGIRASTDNQLRIARMYLYGTFFTALGWLLYNYIISLKVDKVIQAGELRLQQHQLHEKQKQQQQQAAEQYDRDHGLTNTSFYSTMAPTFTIDDDWNTFLAGGSSGGDDATFFSGGSINVMTDDDVYNQALQVMMLPAMVWMLCLFRAYQFYALLQEAEQEAHQRIRDELRLVEDDIEEANNNNNNTNNNNNNNETLSDSQHQQQSRQQPSAPIQMVVPTFGNSFNNRQFHRTGGNTNSSESYAAAVELTVLGRRPIAATPSQAVLA